jgi:hypothetical protein
MQRGFSAIIVLIIPVLVVVGIAIWIIFTSNQNPETSTVSPPQPKIQKQVVTDKNIQSTLAAETEESTPAAAKLLLIRNASGQEPAGQKYVSESLGFEIIAGAEYILKEDSEREFSIRGTEGNIKNGDYRRNFANTVGYPPAVVLGAVVVLDKTPNYDLAPLSIWVFDNPQNLTIDKWYENYWYYPFVWGDFSDAGRAKIAPSEDPTLQNFGAMSAVVEYQPNSPKFIYFINGNRVFLIRVVNGGEKLLGDFKLL